jgi:SAM-dependent methyltransferase
MASTRTTREVFDDWARDHHADGMEHGHRPRVEQAWAELPRLDGDYLEIGVGNGYAIRHMAQGPFAGRRCFGLDVSPHMAERAQVATKDLPNITIECADLLSWAPPEDRRFGLIFSMEVFYYMREIQRGIQRASELLAPGGMLLVMVNYFEENPASHDWPAQLNTPMTLWSGTQYVAGFKRAGLVEVEQSLHAGPPETADPKDPGTLTTRGCRPSR